jgi:hypothetical protein
MERLEERIARHQTELEDLRRRYEERRNHLDDLKQRKHDLEAQLREIDEQIHKVHHGKGARPALATPMYDAVENAPAPVQKRRGKKSLADILVKMVGMASGPITVKQLTSELTKKKGFSTRSNNLSRMVQTRVHELCAQGILRRAEGQPGVVLAGSFGAGQMAAANGKSNVPSAAVQKRRGRPKKIRRGSQMPLHAVLTDLLSKSSEPIGARELTTQVLNSGYQTNSKDFLAVVRLALTKMDNTENVRGEGYRLK